MAAQLSGNSSKIGPKSRSSPESDAEDSAQPQSKRRKEAWSLVKAKSLERTATLRPRRLQPDSDIGDDSSKGGPDQNSPESQDCTKCEGRGRLSSKVTVGDHTIMRGNKEIKRRGHEKTSWKRCQSCKGCGKMVAGTPVKLSRPGMEKPTPLPSGMARQGDESQSEKLHTAPETQGSSSILEASEEIKTPTKQDCSACADDKPIAEYGYRFTRTCTHAREVCQDCVVHWVEAKIEEGEWNTITCPECDILLEYADISQILTPVSESFNRYDDLATKACLSSMVEYRHCLSPTCEAGQLHSGGADSPIFICRSCGHKSCTIHDVPWHQGELCTDYDTRIANAKQVAADNAASEAEVAKMKACPKCKAPFTKNGGCDHMTCTRCRFEFCHLCLGDYALIRTNGNAFHGVGCQYHTSRL